MSPQGFRPLRVQREVGGYSVQPVARVAGVFYHAETSVMFGCGFGSGQGPEGPEQTSGSGGGGAKLRGFIKISPKGVAYEPAVNPTLISVAGIAMIMWSVFWIALALRSLVGRRG